MAVDQFTEKEIARFWSRVDKTDSCWNYTGHLDRDGYGRIYIKRHKKIILGAHRFSVLLHGRDIPAGYVVMHHCDNPSCVNPAHLSPATVAENNLDKQLKGRGRYRSNPPRGSANIKAKLQEQDVIAIRAKYTGKRGELTELAREYNISIQAMHDIVKRKNWKHI